MKILIWIGCIFVASVVQVLLGYAGIGGAIPAVLVYGAMFWSAKALCKKYSESQQRKKTQHRMDAARQTEEFSMTQVDENPQKDNSDEATPVNHQIKFCRKCGFELIEGSEFCSRCGTEIAKEWDA